MLILSVPQAVSPLCRDPANPTDKFRACLTIWLRSTGVPNTNSTNFLVEPLVAFAARLRCRTFEMLASQEISASPDVKINIGFLPETLFHWYKTS